MTKKGAESIPEQLDEVSRMTEDELMQVVKDKTRAKVVRTFAEAIVGGDNEQAMEHLKDSLKLSAAAGNKKEDDKTDINSLAVGDDDEAFYEALIKENVAMLTRKNASPQEVARLSANINIFRKELSLIRSRNVKKGTTLAKVLEAAQKAPKKSTKAKKAKAKVTNAKTRKPKTKN